MRYVQTSYLSELKETESAHREALVELQKMCETMEFMEQERAEMVTKVEAQIEKALASMAVDIDDSDEYDSWPGLCLSLQSGGRLLRPSSQTSRLCCTSDAGMRKQLSRTYYFMGVDGWRRGLVVEGDCSRGRDGTGVDRGGQRQGAR